jgi:gamma-glutamylcyclotransferase
MRLWHYASQAILAQNHLTTSLSATTSSSTSIIPSISPPTTSLSTPTAYDMTISASNSTTNKTLYFGYGSNLWRHQMHNRCPNSTYLGIARLNDFKWIINERGYANVVEIDEPTRQRQRQNAVDLSYAAFDQEAAMKWKGDYENQVWGLVYSLQSSDEARLDRNEGVPFAYTKEMLECDFWPAGDDRNGSSKLEDVTGEKPEKRDMLVYINRDAVTPSEPKEEYVYRMNMGIRDAVKEGVPEGYVREVMRKFIPEVRGEEEVR